MGRLHAIHNNESLQRLDQQHHVRRMHRMPIHRSGRRPDSDTQSKGVKIVYHQIGIQAIAGMRMGKNELLLYKVGALMYTPALNTGIGEKVVDGAFPGLVGFFPGLRRAFAVGADYPAQFAAAFAPGAACSPATTGASGRPGAPGRQFAPSSWDALLARRPS